MGAKYHVQNRSRKGPDITLVVVLTEGLSRLRVLAEVNFRCHVTDGPGAASEVDVVHVFAFTLVEDNRKSEVSNSDVAFAIDEDVFGLQVAVDDPCLVEACQTGHLLKFQKGERWCFVVAHHFGDVKLHFKGTDLAAVEQVMKGPMVQRLEADVSI